MKNIIRIAFAVMLTFGIFYLPGVTTVEVSAQKATQNFIVVNKTGLEINALWISPTSSDEWGEDILGDDILENNESMEITFSRRETAKLWDLRIEDGDGEFIEWERLNLLKIKKVTLYYKNGKTTAVVE